MNDIADFEKIGSVKKNKKPPETKVLERQEKKYEQDFESG